MYEAPSFRLSRCCLNARACALPTASKRGRAVLSAAATKRRRMRQSKRQAQVCEPVVISSNGISLQSGKRYEDANIQVSKS